MSNDTNQDRKMETDLASLKISRPNAPAPTYADITRLYDKSLDSPRVKVEWTWVEEITAKSHKSYTLSVYQPASEERESSGKIDPRAEAQWMLTDDRKQGNPIIWHYKTNSIELVSEIVRMISTKARMVGKSTLTLPVGARGSTLVDLEIPPVFAETISTQQICMQMATGGAAPDNQQYIPTVLQSLSVRGFTGKIEFGHHDQTAQVFFEQGIPTHAAVGPASGDTAMRELISWQLGTILLTAEERTRSKTVRRQLNSLIREAAVLFEQKRFLATAGLTFESVIVRSSHSSATTSGSNVVEAQRKVLQRLNRKCTLIDIIRDLEMEPWDWVPIIYHLLNKQLIEVKPTTQRRSAVEIFGVAGLDVQRLDSQLLASHTGIYTYGAFVLFLQREFHFFQATGQPLSLIVFEIQSRGKDFSAKAQFVSPKTISFAAQRIDLIKRPLDVLAHFEAQDYAILLPHTELKQATILANNIIRALTESSVAESYIEDTSIIVNCGVATLPDQGSTMHELLSGAKLAKDLAKQAGIPLATVSAAEASECASRLIANNLIDAALADDKKTSTELLSETLLTSACLVSPDELDQAKHLLAKMPIPMGIGRVLAMEGHIPEHTIQIADQLSSMVKDNRLSLEQAVTCLELVGKYAVDLDLAFKRVGYNPIEFSGASPLLELWRDGQIVLETHLEAGIHQSATTGLPLGCTLNAMRYMNKQMLAATIVLQKLIRNKQLKHTEAITILESLRQGAVPFLRSLAEYGIPTSAVSDSPVVQLLSAAGVVSESELVAAKEVQLSNDKDLEQNLVDCGLVTINCLDIASQLITEVKGGRLSVDQARRALVSAKDRTDSQDIFVLISELYTTAHETRMGRTELVRAARFVTDEQFKEGTRLAALKQVPILRALLDSGIITQTMFDLLSSAKKHMELGEIDSEQTIILLRYAAETSSGFGETLQKFGWARAMAKKPS